MLTADVLMSGAALQGRYTLYLRNEMFGNIQRVEVDNVTLSCGRYAQYGAAVRVTFRPKGKRKLRCVRITSHPFLVIVNGWQAPEPATMWGTAEVCKVTGLPHYTSTYSAHDPRWDADFMAKIAGIPVVADFATWDAYSGGFRTPCTVAAA